MNEIPHKIANAIAQAMKGVSKLRKSEKNDHGRYRYASIDDFLEDLRPKLAENGLSVISDEVHREHFTIQEKNGPATFAFYKFAFYIAHSECNFTYGPIHRTVDVRFVGPQTSGQAQSYCEKMFLRSLLKVATGDQDADSQPQVQNVAIKPKAQDISAEALDKARIALAEGEETKVQQVKKYVADMKTKGYNGPNIQALEKDIA